MFAFFMASTLMLQMYGLFVKIQNFFVKFFGIPYKYIFYIQISYAKRTLSAIF